jgi:hypothetical protein
MAATKWLTERRRLLGSSASELIFALTGLDPECENYAIATTFAIDNLLHHTFLDDPVADGMVLATEQLDRLADRALEHSRLERVAALRGCVRVARACPPGSQRDALARAISTLYQLSSAKAMIDLPLRARESAPPRPRPASAAAEEDGAAVEEAEGWADYDGADASSEASQALSDASTASDTLRATDGAAGAAGGSARASAPHAARARAPAGGAAPVGMRARPLEPIPAAVRAERERWEASRRTAPPPHDLCAALLLATPAGRGGGGARAASAGAAHARGELRLGRELLATLTHALVPRLEADGSAAARACRRLTRAPTAEPRRELRGAALPLLSAHGLESMLASTYELHARATHLQAFAAFAAGGGGAGRVPRTVRAFASELQTSLLAQLALELAQVQRGLAVRGMGGAPRPPAAAALWRVSARARAPAGRGDGVAPGGLSALALGSAARWRSWRALLSWLCRVVDACGFRIDHAGASSMSARRARRADADGGDGGDGDDGGPSAGADDGEGEGNDGGSRWSEGAALATALLDTLEAEVATLAAAGDAALCASARALLAVASGAYFQLLEPWLARGELSDPHAELLLARNGRALSGRAHLQQSHQLRARACVPRAYWPVRTHLLAAGSTARALRLLRAPAGARVDARAERRGSPSARAADASAAAAACLAVEAGELRARLSALHGCATREGAACAHRGHERATATRQAEVFARMGDAQRSDACDAAAAERSTRRADADAAAADASADAADADAMARCAGLGQLAREADAVGHVVERRALAFASDSLLAPRRGHASPVGGLRARADGGRTPPATREPSAPSEQRCLRLLASVSGRQLLALLLDAHGLLACVLQLHECALAPAGDALARCLDAARPRFERDALGAAAHAGGEALAPTCVSLGPLPVSLEFVQQPPVAPAGAPATAEREAAREAAREEASEEASEAAREAAREAASEEASVRVGCAVGWPSDLLVDDGALRRYSRLATLLLRLQCARQALAQCAKAIGRGAAGAEAHALRLLLWPLLQSASAVHMHLATNIVNVLRARFVRDAASAASLDELLGARGATPRPARARARPSAPLPSRPTGPRAPSAARPPRPRRATLLRSRRARRARRAPRRRLARSAARAAPLRA